MGASDLFGMDKVVSYYGSYGIISSGKFLVSIVGTGNKVQSIFAGKNLGFMAETFSIAPPYLGTSEYFNHGRSLPFINDYKMGSGSFGIFDTGVEYGYFERYFASVFDTRSGLYAYPDEVTVDIKVFEYNRMSEIKEIHEFHKCYITEYGKRTLTHMATDITKFDVTFYYKEYKWEAGN